MKTNLDLARECGATAIPGAFQANPDVPAPMTVFFTEAQLDDFAAFTRADAWWPRFDAMTQKQEALAWQFCQEIAGKRGGKGCAPDSVRLLEMAQALYQAERDDQ